MIKKLLFLVLITTSNNTIAMEEPEENDKQTSQINNLYKQLMLESDFYQQLVQNTINSNPLHPTSNEQKPSTDNLYARRREDPTLQSLFIEEQEEESCEPPPSKINNQNIPNSSRFAKQDLAFHKKLMEGSEQTSHFKKCLEEKVAILLTVARDPYYFFKKSIQEKIPTSSKSQEEEEEESYEPPPLKFNKYLNVKNPKVVEILAFWEKHIEGLGDIKDLDEKLAFCLETIKDPDWYKKFKIKALNECRDDIIKLMNEDEDRDKKKYGPVTEIDDIEFGLYLDIQKQLAEIHSKAVIPQKIEQETYNENDTRLMGMGNDPDSTLFKHIQACLTMTARIKRKEDLNENRFKMLKALLTCMIVNVAMSSYRTPNDEESALSLAFNELLLEEPIFYKPIMEKLESGKIRVFPQHGYCDPTEELNLGEKITASIDDLRNYFFRLRIKAIISFFTILKIVGYKNGALLACERMISRFARDDLQNPSNHNPKTYCNTVDSICKFYTKAINYSLNPIPSPKRPLEFQKYSVTPKLFDLIESLNSTKFYSKEVLDNDLKQEPNLATCKYPFLRAAQKRSLHPIYYHNEFNNLYELTECALQSYRVLLMHHPNFLDTSWYMELSELKNVLSSNNDGVIKVSNQFLANSLLLILKNGGIIYWINIRRMLRNHEELHYIQEEYRALTLMEPMSEFRYNLAKKLGMRMAQNPIFYPTNTIKNLLCGLCQITPPILSYKNKTYNIGPEVVRALLDYHYDKCDIHYDLDYIKVISDKENPQPYINEIDNEQSKIVPPINKENLSKPTKQSLNKKDAAQSTLDKDYCSGLKRGFFK
jgi:hypothetical protein